MLCLRHGMNFITQRTKRIILIGTILLKMKILPFGSPILIIHKFLELLPKLFLLLINKLCDLVLGT